MCVLVSESKVNLLITGSLSTLHQRRLPESLSRRFLVSTHFMLLMGNMPGFHLWDLIFQPAPASVSAALSAQSPNELSLPVQCGLFPPSLNLNDVTRSLPAAFIKD